MRGTTTIVGLSLLVASCTTGGTAETEAPTARAPATDDTISTTTLQTPATTVAATATTTTTTTPDTTTTVPAIAVTGTVTDDAGRPLAGVTVTTDQAAVTTSEDGRFELSAIDDAVSFIKPAWMPVDANWTTAADGDVEVVMVPRIVRGVRVSRYNFTERDGLASVLEVIAGTTVNALVFDTKDETGTTLYPTNVAFANEIGAVTEIYDPAQVIAVAQSLNLYTITRVVTFEDPIWTNAQPGAKLAGRWIDARNPANWEYPLALATEACEIGFDEIQFDYVRFPAGITADAAPRTTQEERLDAISGFLGEARSRLNPMGCAVSADIFGIVASSPTDEGIGQRPDELSLVTDALSPMIYPSHYSNGWLGFSDPNDHPGPVTADALNGALPRMASGSALRPWLQAFYYNGAQIQAAIAEAEQRGLGWLLWNAAGRYSKSALPVIDN